MSDAAHRVAFTFGVREMQSEHDVAEVRRLVLARRRGYRTLRLGTLQDMTAAQALYRTLGFTPIARYRPDELIDSQFYELSLP